MHLEFQIRGTVTRLRQGDGDPGEDFSGLQIAGVDVSLRYVDPAKGINATDMVTFTSAADVRSFAYDYSNANISAQYSVVIRLQNNQTRSVDWTPVSGNNVVVPISQAMGNS